MSSNALKLIVKTPNQKIDDQVYTCDPEWSVYSLKNHIKNNYPSKPVSLSSAYYLQ